MSLKIASLAAALAMAAITPSLPAAAQAPAVAPPPAPAFKVGASVVDNTGTVLGVVVGVGEAGSGAMSVVVKIDGKLISVPEGMLSFRGDNLVSSRSKAQLLAMAAAPP